METLTGYDKVLQKVDGHGSTDAGKAYSSSMMNALNIGTGTTNYTVGQTTPLQKKAWDRVLYGPSDEAHDNLKSQTSISTLTQDNGRKRFTQFELLNSKN